MDSSDEVRVKHEGRGATDTQRSLAYLAGPCSPGHSVLRCQGVTHHFQKPMRLGIIGD